MIIHYIASVKIQPPFLKISGTKGLFSFFSPPKCSHVKQHTEPVSKWRVLRGDLREPTAVIDGPQEGGEVLLLTERAHPGSAGDHRGQSGSPCPTWPHVVWERASEMCLIFSHLSPPRETQGAPIYNEYLESRRDHRREPQLEQQETPWEVNSGKDSRNSRQTYDFLMNDFVAL